MKKSGGTILWTWIGIFLLLLFWEGASLVVKSSLILPGPFPVALKFLTLLRSKRFLLSLFSSFVRVFTAIVISAPLGVIAGSAAGLNRRFYALIKPLLQVISSTPVMAVILIVFLWFGTERTPVFTAFLTVFPVMASNTIEGIHSIDPKLTELFAVYRISKKEKFLSLYFPGTAPFILGGLRSSLSLCWKVVVAAEVLVQPFRALGTGMQNAKGQLETAELLAWTAGTVCAAALSRFIMDLVLRRSHAHY
jgi:NitT/TauT family transport system permease protein